MEQCDWIGCSEKGNFNGVRDLLLNAEGKKNVQKSFAFLCQRHFDLAVNVLHQQRLEAATAKGVKR